MFIVILFIFLGILSGVLYRKLSTGARISLTDVADPLLPRRIMHPHRHLAQLQPAPDAAGQHFGFKVVVTAAEPQLRQRRDRIGAEPALAVAARHTGFDLQPEVRESAPETAAAAGREIGSAEGQGAAVAEDCEDKKKERMRHWAGEQAFEL